MKSITIISTFGGARCKANDPHRDVERGGDGRGHKAGISDFPLPENLNPKGVEMWLAAIEKRATEVAKVAPDVAKLLRNKKFLEELEDVPGMIAKRLTLIVQSRVLQKYLDDKHGVEEAKGATSKKVDPNAEMV